MIGLLIKGKYKLLQELGQSPLGEFYLAMNLSTNEVASVWLLGPDLADRGQFLARFQHEAGILDTVHSRGIVRLLDYGEDEGRTFVVQEYVAGITLEYMLKNAGALELRRALSLAQQIAQCLADASAAGLVHRDLRPSYIIVNASEEARIAGFGVMAGLNYELPQPYKRSAYLAPERLAGESGDVRADVYSLGVILFEMVTGQLPYSEDGPHSAPLERQKTVQLAHQFRSGIPRELDVLLTGCLAWAPGERPLPSALIRSLAEILRAETIAGVEANLAGTTLGRYQLLERVGRGAMSSVYRGYQPGLDRYVAVKVLPTYLSREPNFAARFVREARAIARLRHPNILPVHDFGQEGDLAYIVMQYVEAGTLNELLTQPWPLDRTTEIVSQIAAALDHAHGQGIIHRDVKPNNILMAEGRWALLTDFGLARLAEGSTRITASGLTIGTPAYMSPEQGQGLEIDLRSDVYSLGVVLYEMLTGRLPYDADTPIAIVLKHITAPVPLPSELDPSFPESVERVISTALAKNPADRYGSAGELAAALRLAVQLAGQPSERQGLPPAGAPGVGGASAVQPPKRRVAIPLLWGGVVCVALVVVLAALLGLFGRMIGVSHPNLAASPAGQMASETWTPVPDPLAVALSPTQLAAVAVLPLLTPDLRVVTGSAYGPTPQIEPRATFASPPPAVTPSAGLFAAATREPPTPARPAPAVDTGAVSTAAAREISLAVAATLTAQPSPTATFVPTSTSTPALPTASLNKTATALPPSPTRDAGATATVEAQKVALAVGATLTAQPSPTPMPPTASPGSTATEPPPSPTPDEGATATVEAQKMALAVAATLTAQPSPTATATSTSSATPVPPTASPSSTATALPPSPTPDEGATATVEAQKMALAVAATLTAQPSPTATATSTSSATPVPPTASPSSTATALPPSPTPDAGATATVEARKLAVAVAATLTALPTVAPTASPTPTPTLTPAPTATPTATETRTLPPPTATRTASPTPTAWPPTATSTASATPTTVPATPTPTVTPSLASTTPPPAPPRPTATSAPVSTAASASGQPAGEVATDQTPSATENQTVTPSSTYAAPMLLNPGDGYATGDGRVDFQWDWQQTLGPGECFELAMSGQKEGPFWGAVACMEARQIAFNVLDARHIQPGPIGQYYWTVRVNRQLPTQEWVTVSATAEPREVRISGGGGGSGNGGGGGGKPPPPPP